MKYLSTVVLTTWCFAVVALEVHAARNDSYPELPIPVKECPHWFDIRTEYVANNFVNEKYQGFWYEHAKQDSTQPFFCGCTNFDWRFLPESASETEEGLDVLDVFTLTCPKIGNIQGLNFFTNLTIELFDDLPGYYIESWGTPEGDGNCNGADGPIGDLPFCQRENSFADMIVYLEVTQDESGEDQYESSIQFQCQEDEDGIVFTALNFLTKSPTITDEHLERLFQAAEDLGLGWAMEWGRGTLRVDHEDCIYPFDDIDDIHEEWQNGRPE